MLSTSNSPYIVAEMSASHCGSLERAFAIVDAAADAGADAVKLQTWDVITLDTRPIESGPWKGRSLVDLYEEAITPWEWHPLLFDRCRERGIDCFSAPFDLKSVDFLETLNCPIYKIASFEIPHLELVAAAAETGKPIIISTGMASIEEIAAAVETATKHGAGGITLLKCTSAYPAPIDQANLITMADMYDQFGCAVGLSDHTTGLTCAGAATALGASVIEKHLGLDDQGPDGHFSARPEEFALMVQVCRQVATAMGEVRYGGVAAEADSRQFRRSVWAIADIEPGEPFTRQNVALLRPAGGIEPALFPDTLTRKASRALTRGEPITEDCVLGPLTGHYW